MDVSFFLPFYNEEAILHKNTMLLYVELKKTTQRFELVLVDDSSTDNSGAIASALAKLPHIRYKRFSNGPSRRENLAKTFRDAKFGIVAFCDVDLSTSLKHLPRLFRNIQDGADISIGSKFMSIKPDRSIARKAYSRTYNASIRTLFSSRVRDHQCGFKAFRKDVLLRILDIMGYDSSMARGWFWDAGLLIRAQKLHYKIVEFPVEWKSGEKSTFSFKRELRMIPYILKLRGRL